MIQLDSDGVLADWRWYMEKHHFKGFTVPEFNAMDPCRRSSILQEIYRKDPDLFEKLPRIREMGRVIQYLNRSGEPWGVITSAGEDHPDFEYAAVSKKNWLLKNFDIEPHRVIVTESSSDKAQHAGPDTLLIDDFGRNCREWCAAGGKAIWVHTGKPDVDAILQAIEDFINGKALFQEPLISV
ncbi:hypothetical protein PHOBOS_230 [Erwinia phage vB_EamM_Phobos]|uniref:hypothetical protein n=1 Tax=Erwinia phage vB_EamM_Phobos TaxID=1883377 RepID=UPI00081CA874|nr:hypothetical protein BIZ79_gp230 [Erwinia phage vB_EamM_Phobos]ANZ50420.1 hypothetical protein PHOBOS_230 [Erwinia phage vB_EamM_Phobos]